MATSILSPTHLALLLVVVLLLFGAKRLPELGKSLGASMRAFRESVDGRADGQWPQPTAAADPQPHPEGGRPQLTAAADPQPHPVGGSRQVTAAADPQPDSVGGSQQVTATAELQLSGSEHAERQPQVPVGH